MMGPSSVWRVIASVAAVLLASSCGGEAFRTNLPPLMLDGLDGDEWSLQSEAGHIVVLQLFATFDNSSIALTTALEQLHIRFGERGVRFIGVAMDPPTVPRRREVVESFCALNNLTFEVVLADEALGRGLSPLGRIPAIPATVIFDRRGDPVASVVGPFDPDEVGELLEAMIEGRPHPLLQPLP